MRSPAHLHLSARLHLFTGLQQAAWTHKAYEKEITSVNRWRGGRKLGAIAPAIGGAIARSRAAIRSGLADLKYTFGDTSGHHGRRFYTRAVALPATAGAMGGAGAGAGAAGLVPVAGGSAAGPAVTETLRQLEQPQIQQQPLMQPQMQAASAAPAVKPAPSMMVPAAAGAGLGAAGMGAAGMAGGMGGQPGARTTPVAASAPLKQPMIQQQQVQQQSVIQSSQALPPSGVMPAQTLSSGGGALAGLAPQAGGMGSGGGMPLDMPILQAK